MGGGLNGAGAAERLIQSVLAGGRQPRMFPYRPGTGTTCVFFTSSITM